MLRCASASDVTETFASTIACAMVFLSTRHEWNKDRLDAEPKPHEAPWDGWRVPENEVCANPRRPPSSGSRGLIETRPTMRLAPGKLACP